MDATDGVYIDEQDRLVEEAFVIFGMIDEIRAKSRLMLNQIRVMKVSGRIDDDFITQTDIKVQGFHSSLRKYDTRLDEIGLILKEQYGLDVV